MAFKRQKKKDFSSAWLESISGRKTFHWSGVPSVGLAGGMLVGVDDEIFEVGECNRDKFYIHMLVRNRVSGFKWNLVNVYGAAHEKDKEEFLVELSEVLGINAHPFVVGGDFNLIRKIDERNKQKASNKWSFLFNGIIENWSLRDLEMSGRKFTWSNNQENPFFERLDRVLVSPEWERQYPLVTLRALCRNISDHAGLLLVYETPAPRSIKPFRFERCWFIRKGIDEIVIKAWNSVRHAGDELDFWQDVFKELRKTLKGWDFNIEGHNKRLKKDLQEQIDVLDIASETFGLSAENRNLKHNLELQLHQLDREEEIKWSQRSKELELLEGDSNTSYFMTRANGRRRKTRIFSLQSEEGMVEGDKNLLNHATQFYKNLFGPNETINISLNIPVPKVLNDTDRTMLSAAFSLDEIRTAVFQMEQNKSPGPDGFPVEFFQKFWGLIKYDLVRLFQAFYDRKVNLARIMG